MEIVHLFGSRHGTSMTSSYSVSFAATFSWTLHMSSLLGLNSMHATLAHGHVSLAVAAVAMKRFMLSQLCIGALVSLGHQNGLDNQILPGLQTIHGRACM